MKKIIVFFITLILIVNLTKASNPIDLLNKIPSNFKSECFEFYSKIPRNKFEIDKTYNILTNKSDIILTQSWYLLPTKLIKSEKKYYDYTLNIAQNNTKTSSWDIVSEDELINNEKLEEIISKTYKYLNDDDEKTFINYNIDSQSWEIIINLNEEIKSFEFEFNFIYFSENYWTSYSISKDWITYSKVNRYEINKYSFKYLKIWLISLEKNYNYENIKIYDLSFSKNINYFQINSFSNNDIELYSKYSCNETFLNPKQENDYEIIYNEEDIQNISVDLNKNPKYNIYNKPDIDNDWIQDDLDNCKNIYNPNQEDINKDNIWDACSDDDKDWIIWFYDNCPNIENIKQEDNNNNNIWDVCESDKDLDGILDWLDNCINIKNSDQLDDDLDDVWNLCDNCNSYNPGQLDLDKNSIWDICDDIKKELLKTDSDLDWILNIEDNCKIISNKDQADTDKDWVWDACDNCKDIANSKQIDLNKNNIWDFCEDSDSDGIIWYKDNCLNTTNINQEDEDKNGVWDFCEDKDYDNVIFIKDNCPIDFNPDQKDSDNDLIWDNCDDYINKYTYYDKIIYLLVFIFIGYILWHLIWIIMRKIIK